MISPENWVLAWATAGQQKVIRKKKECQQQNEKEQHTHTEHACTRAHPSPSHPPPTHTHTCASTHTHACMCAHAHTHTHTHTHTLMHVHTHTHTHTHACTHTHTLMHAHTHTQQMKKFCFCTKNNVLLEPTNHVQADICIKLIWSYSFWTLKQNSLWIEQEHTTQCLWASTCRHQLSSPDNFYYSSVQLCCLMSSDVGWHIRDKLRRMPKHGSI